MATAATRCARNRSVPAGAPRSPAAASLLTITLKLALPVRIAWNHWSRVPRFATSRTTSPNSKSNAACQAQHGAQALKIVEEVGKVCRAVDAPEDPQGRVNDLGEAADVLIMLMSVINRAGIDLGEAFRRKEERNESRVWR
jgi:NTP pyrophosphatase (non-canonical NTP hydrolase)